MIVFPNLQRPGPRRSGVITAIVQGIATVTLDGGGTVPFHPSSYRSGNYEVGMRVEVLGGSSGVQAEQVWRA